MSALSEKFVNNARSAAMAAPIALGLGIMATFGAANDAHAQEVSTIAQPRHELQMADKRDRSRDAVQLFTTQLSKGAQTLLLYGPNKSSFNEVTEAAQNALISDDNQLNWVVVASGPPELAFYTDGFLTHTILNPTGDELDQIITDQLAKDLIRVRELKEEVDVAMGTQTNTLEVGLN